MIKQTENIMDNSSNLMLSMCTVKYILLHSGTLLKDEALDSDPEHINLEVNSTDINKNKWV